jgi:dethiobiotin synthetase
MTGCFVTGTDTGVGKTLITAALAHYLKQRGLRVAVMKPIETGCADAQPGNSDAERLAASISDPSPIDLISPYRFTLPVAPLTAARAAGKPIDIGRIAATFRRVAQEQDVVLVEGVGGVMVPVSDKMDVRDVIASLRLPALIVGRAALGGVNHALLTVEALRQRGIPIIGIALNQLEAHTNTDQVLSTVDLIRERSGVRVFHPIAYEATACEDWKSGMMAMAQTATIRALGDWLVQPSR